MADLDEKTKEQEFQEMKAKMSRVTIDELEQKLIQCSPIGAVEVCGDIYNWMVTKSMIESMWDRKTETNIIRVTHHTGILCERCKETAKLLKYGSGTWPRFLLACLGLLALAAALWCLWGSQTLRVFLMPTERFLIAMAVFYVLSVAAVVLTEKGPDRDWDVLKILLLFHVFSFGSCILPILIHANGIYSVFFAYATIVTVLIVVFRFHLLRALWENGKVLLFGLHSRARRQYEDAYSLIDQAIQGISEGLQGAELALDVLSEGKKDENAFSFERRIIDALKRYYQGYYPILRGEKYAY